MSSSEPDPRDYSVTEMAGSLPNVWSDVRTTPGAWDSTWTTIGMSAKPLPRTRRIIFLMSGPAREYPISRPCACEVSTSTHEMRLSRVSFPFRFTRFIFTLSLIWRSLRTRLWSLMDIRAIHWHGTSRSREANFKRCLQNWMRGCLPFGNKF